MYKDATNPPRVRVSVGIVVHNGRVLIGRRPPGVRLAGLWEFPGGKIEPHEAPEACLKRELREETGLHVDIIQALAPIVHADADLTVEICPYLCRIAPIHRLGEDVSPAIQPRVNSQLRWVMPGELADYPFPPANAPLLLRLVEILRKQP